MKTESIFYSRSICVVLFYAVFLSYELVYARHYSISLELDMKTDGYEFLVADVIIGTPPKSYRLQVDFDVDKTYVFENLEQNSITYSNELSGSDFIVVGGEFKRMEIKSDRFRNYSPNVLICGDCQGILGLGKSSMIWKLFQDMTISRDMLTLKDIGPEVGYNKGERMQSFHCTGRKGLCETSGTIRFLDTVFPSLRIIFDPTRQNVILPKKIYDIFTKGRNIYKDDIKKWPKLDISIWSGELDDTFSISTKRVKAIKDRFGLDISDLSEWFNFTIDPSTHMYITRNYGKVLLIKPGTDESTVILGTSMIKEYIFFINNPTRTVIVQLFHTQDHLSIENIFFFAFLLTLLIRWRVTNSHLLSDKIIKSREHLIEYIYEFVGVASSIAVFFFPSTFRYMETNFDLYIGTTILLFFSVFFKILVFITHIRKKHDPRSFSPASNPFEANLYRSFTQEVILLTGLWIVLLERRLENESNILILFVNVYLVYAISYYNIIGIIYFSTISKLYIKRDRPNYYKGIKNPSGKFIFGLLLFVIVWIYQILVSVNFFVRPLFVQNLQTYQELVVPFLVLLYLFLVAAAALIVQLSIIKSLSVQKNEPKSAMSFPHTK